MTNPVELVPGTALPITPPGAATQLEGRGTVIPNPERAPQPLEDRTGPGGADEIGEGQFAIVEQLLRRYDHSRKTVRTYFTEQSDQTDGTTGNCVLQLFEVPQGGEAHISNVIVDAPQSATITPAAPYGNAASFAFLAISSPINTDSDSAAAALRTGMVAFAPVSAAGPIIPGQWTFNDSNAPVAFGGSMVYFVLVGGSIAAVLNLNIRARCRVNLHSRPGG
jgi:hypothetical protein